MSHTEHIAYLFFVFSVSISLKLFGLLIYYLCKKKPVESEETLPTKLCARAYTLTDIDAATDGFNHRRIVGQGRLGTVYAAILKEEVAAVKRIHPRLVLSNPGFGFSTVIKHYL